MACAAFRQGHQLPHEAMLPALDGGPSKEKAEKLLGNSASGTKGYL